MVPATYLSQASCFKEEDGHYDDVNKENLDEKPWYFENIISRNNSDKILDMRGKPGDFLIRRAETQVN